ncbi:MAG: ABC transporter ATP-binding protein [Gammaproteobacteria bacterium]|jgi:ABC-2 type transport system ATP-binding protein
MIEVNEVSRSYGSLVAVDDVTFSVGSGEIVGLLGHNGAGKSTIMKMLTGFLEPTSGRIRIGDLDTQQYPVRARRLIGYLPENCPLYPEMRVMEYLCFQAALKGITPSLQEQQALRVIRQTQLCEKGTSPIKSLSRGQRQRVGVARALLGDPKILILDEPTNGLDPSQITQMRQLIRNAAQQATVLVSTHILQEVEAVCDRVLILRGGKLVVDQPLDELQRSSRLRVVVDAPGGEARAVLEKIAPLESDGEGYLLDCSGVDVTETARKVSSRLAEARIGLLALQPIGDSLESLFRDAQDPRTSLDA